MNAENFLAKVSSTGGEPTNFQEKTFLVVDDVVSMRASLRNTISTLGGTRIDMAGNGIEAINRLEQRTMTSSCATTIWAAARMANSCWRKPNAASW